MKKKNRRYLPVIGSALVATGLTFSVQLVLADTVNAKYPENPVKDQNVFTRMFPNLESFAPKTDEARTVAKNIGVPGGLMDAKDNLTDPIQSITNPAIFSPNNFDNPNMTAGVTFFGQFLDHDITLDKKSELNAFAKPQSTVNYRSTWFDLDSIYGSGPAGSSALYETSNGRIKFKVRVLPGAELVSRRCAIRYDLPRAEDGTAIVAESRNDENIVISQFHTAMLKFHNAVTDYLAEKPEYARFSADQLFDEARKTVTWHYQWIILNEYLPLIIGQNTVNSILTKGPQFYTLTKQDDYIVMDDGTKLPRLPIEFSVAAFRFGHSQVRPSYRVNFGPTGGSPFFAFIFNDKLSTNDPDPADMRGGRPAARRFIDWQTFFNFGDGNSRSNKLIDIKLSSPLMLLPGATGPVPGLPDDGLQSLASRNLVRHVNFGIPSGQSIAKVMKTTPLTTNDLSELTSYTAGGVTMAASTPLWYYILKEAQIQQGGKRLGVVGGNIVGEVFISLLKKDPKSYLTLNPQWAPSLPSATPGSFKITDLLNFAGVVPPL